MARHGMEYRRVGGWCVISGRERDMSGRTDGSDGGPAFPRTDGVGAYEQDGMSLRDYFAGQALVGIFADPNLEMTNDKIAEWSYRVADNMIEARED